MKIPPSLAEPWNSEPADVHAVQGDSAGVQSRGSGTGDHHPGDDRRRRWVVEWQAAPFCGAECNANSPDLEQYQWCMPHSGLAGGIRHVRHANDGHKSISRWPQLFFTYLGPAKFQILRLIDMPDKWPIRPRKWGGYMVCISHIKCSTRCRCSSFRNKFAFVCTFSFSVPCNISMVSQMRVEEGKAKQQLWDSLNHKMPLPCNEANK